VLCPSLQVRCLLNFELMIEVKHIKDTEYQITWDETNLVESKLNNWTEEDFIKVIRDFLDEVEK